MDEIAFRWHQLAVWAEFNWWGHQYVVAYPFMTGLVVGLVVGYYAEPAAELIERWLGRRAMRKRLKKKSSNRLGQ